MTKLFKLFSLTWLLLIPLTVFSQKKYRWADELSLLENTGKLPQYRTGSYIESFPGYDRTHGSDDGFTETYSFLHKEGDEPVIAEMKGPGAVDRIWALTPSETMLYFYSDGSKKSGPQIKLSGLFSGKVHPFVRPVCGNEMGRYYCYVSATYKKSCKVIYDGPKLGSIQIGYHDLTARKVEIYGGQFTRRDKQLLQEVCNLWNTNEYKMNLFTRDKSSDIKTMEKEITLRPGKTINCSSLDTPGRIVGMEINGGTVLKGDNKDVIPSASWGGEFVEAIYSPLQGSFGYTFGRGAICSLLMGKQGNSNYCLLPAPFDHSVRMDLMYRECNEYRPTIITRAKIRYNQQDRIKGEGKFYSAWSRQKTPIGTYHTFLHTKAKEYYVDTILQSQGLRSGVTLFFEGGDSTHVDDKMRLHGTGSEDYLNDGWYVLLDRWDRGVSLPAHGSFDYSLPTAQTGGYCLHINDKMSFEKEIYHGMGHGGQNSDLPADYISVAMFYADCPFATRQEPQSELLKVCEPTIHIYFLQLFEVTIGSDMNISSDHEAVMTTNNQGETRIMFSHVPDGKYKVSIGYATFSGDADFQVWQRQKQLSDWISVEAAKREEKNRLHVGNIDPTQ